MMPNDVTTTREAPAMETSEIRMLRAFRVFVAERSVSRASERLGLSQPATSHLLARLRAMLDDPLLTRARNGMLPTDRALELDGVARDVLASFDRLTALGKGFDPATSQRNFTVSAPEYAERLLAGRVLRSARAAAPSVRVTIRAPQPERALEQLESGELDMRIAWLPAPMKSLRSVQLFQDRLVCIADRRAAGIEGRLTLEQFVTLPHVRTATYSQTHTGKVIEDAIQRHARVPVRPFLVHSFAAIPFTIPGSDLIATLPRRLAVEYARAYGLQVLEAPVRLPTVRYAAYWHERSHKDPAHVWLRGLVVAAARSLRGA